VPLYLLLQHLQPGLYIGLFGLLFLAGIPICSYVDRQMDVHDHPGIVWDEIVGYLVTMTFAPAGWVWVVTGFVLFRVFDIAKPWPIRWCDRQVSGGLGIMLDDLLAGVAAAMVLQLVNHFG
jgi:phosphatidylglycerophosphatase A